MIFGIKEKIIAFLALIAGFFAFKSKLQKGKIDSLKDQVSASERLETIEKAMDVAEKEAETNEIESKSNLNDDDWRDSI